VLELAAHADVAVQIEDRLRRRPARDRRVGAVARGGLVEALLRFGRRRELVVVAPRAFAVALFVLLFAEIELVVGGGRRAELRIGLLLFRPGLVLFRERLVLLLRRLRGRWRGEQPQREQRREREEGARKESSHGLSE